MSLRRVRGASACALALCLLCATFAPPSGARQQPTPASAPQADEVVRVSSALVQTGVSVSDRKGRFVGDLESADFELRVDGRPQPITFFERVKGGVRAAPSPSKSPGANVAGAASATPTAATPRGRSVLFFVDDLHLAPDSIVRARRMLLRYVEREMRAGDRALITSANNQVGFLQQLTDEKEVLRAAAERLKSRRTLERDMERPPMSVFQALAIEQNNSDLVNHYVTAILSQSYAGFTKSNPAGARTAAEQQVRGRARRILRQAGFLSDYTLGALEAFVRAAAPLPGRKLVVFVSDGFFLDPALPGTAERLRRVADAAARAGVVVDTIQASGLGTTFPDAASDDFVDPNGDTGRAPLGEDTAVQTPLSALAADTGGRALLNANDLDDALSHALAEADDYYVLAWQPPPELFRDAKFHKVEVRVTTRKDATVRVHRGFFGGEAPAQASEQSGAAQEPWQQLAAAVSADQFEGTLDTHLNTAFIDTPRGGPTLALLLQVPVEPDAEDGPPGSVDVAGAIYDERGKTVGTFIERLDAEPGARGRRQSVIYYDQVSVRPGLYQVRAAARDGRTGAVGRSSEWVEVPDLRRGSLALSSLLIGERAEGTQPSGAPQFVPRARLKIDRRFGHDSHLRFLIYVYNAARTGARPRLSARVELLRADKTPVATIARDVETNGVEDLARIPYAEDLTLAPLPRGRYLLRVTITDAAARASATRESDFEIE